MSVWYFRPVHWGIRFHHHSHHHHHHHHHYPYLQFYHHHHHHPHNSSPSRIMQACMDVVIPYVGEREQFGQKIGTFQVRSPPPSSPSPSISPFPSSSAPPPPHLNLHPHPHHTFQLMQGKLADMYTSLSCCRAFTYAGARAADRGEASRVDCASIILYTAEQATHMALQAIQTLGNLPSPSPSPSSFAFSHPSPPPFPSHSYIHLHLHRHPRIQVAMDTLTNTPPDDFFVMRNYMKSAQERVRFDECLLAESFLIASILLFIPLLFFP